MAIRITVAGLRNIDRLDFDVPSPGVWLLTGPNGTGKTTILACLRRIGYKNSFPVHFPSSNKSARLDSSQGASVTYDVNGQRITYTYRGQRWAPSPKANSGLLQGAGYSSVRYIAANAERIEPRKDDFFLRRITNAPQQIIDAANRIFRTTKFDSLRTINLRRGAGNQAFLLELPPVRNQKFFHSEKNFSLGELCVLKLLRLIGECNPGAMLLIDEIELALHPTAQIELLSYLNDISREKNLTVVVSTHSASLIKHSPRKNTLLMQASGNGIECVAGCYPSYVLGAMAYNEETSVDVLIYVEDTSAASVLGEMLQHVLADQFANATINPSYQIIPVGGFANVLRFFDKQQPLLAPHIRANIVLDEDARLSLQNAQQADIQDILRRRGNQISYLPYTPEVGLVEALHNSTLDFQQELRQHYHLNNLIIRQVDLRPLPPQQAPNRRDLCKIRVEALCVRIAQQIPAGQSSEVKNVLFRILGKRTFQANRAATLQLVAPLLR